MDARQVKTNENGGRYSGPILTIELIDGKPACPDLLKYQRRIQLGSTWK